MKSTRNSSLDVFRCLSMFLIVLSHAYCYGCCKGASAGLMFLYSTLLVWHVNAFTSLSGWFGIRFSVGKLIRLYGVIVFYSLLGIVVERFCFGRSAPFAISGGWYGDAYLCLFLLAPFLNAGVEKIAELGPRKAWSLWSGFAIVMVVNWMSRNPYIGFLAYDIAPYTLVQLVFVYITVRLFRLTNVTAVVRFWHIGLVACAYVLISSLIGHSRQNYLAPHVIAMAIALLVLFERYVKFPRWLGRGCVYLAPSMFGVYLIHEGSQFGRALFRIPLQKMIGYGAPPWLAVLMGAVTCFVLCVTIDIARRFLIDGIRQVRYWLKREHDLDDR